MLEHPPADDGIEVAEFHKVELLDVADELLIGILVPGERLGITVDRDEVRRSRDVEGKVEPSTGVENSAEPSVSEMTVEEALDVAQFIILYDTRSLVRRQL